MILQKEVTGVFQDSIVFWQFINLAKIFLLNRLKPKRLETHIDFTNNLALIAESHDENIIYILGEQIIGLSCAEIGYQMKNRKD